MPLLAAGLKSPSPLSAVWVEGSRSAEPPVNAGTRGAMAFITLPEAARVAIVVGGKHRHVRIPVARQLSAQRSSQLLRELRESFRVSAHSIIARRFVVCTARHRFAEMRQRLFGHQKRRLGGPAEVLLGQAHLVRAQRRSMRLERVVLVRRAEADVCTYKNQRWS